MKPFGGDFMSAMIFNSRDKKYKSKYGALISGDEVSFRLLLPDESGAAVSCARMLILSDESGAEKAFAFTPTSEKEGDYKYWELRYTAEDVGLYWYCFEIERRDSGAERIYRGAYGTGYIGAAEARWQLTVYKNAYDAPNSFSGGIMYQIFPDRFKNSGLPKVNVPNDRKIKPWGTPPEWKPDKFGNVLNNDYLGGDLKGIEEKLPYLKKLGVTVIYLNPIFEAHSNHRYNTANYLKIDPLLGTEVDFVSLCNAAHKLEIKIILDGVFSHTGDDSIYFNKYRRYDSVGAYNSTESPYYKWYKFQDWPQKYTSWWGIDILPETIEETPEFIDYITGPGGIVEKWLRLGADGWRLDVADELPDMFIEKIRERIEAVKPGALLLGEVWEDASNKEAYGVRRKYILGKGLSSVMNYPFTNAIISYLAYNDAEGFMDRILTITENYPPEITNLLMNPLGTHDTMRIITRLSGESCENKDRAWQEKFTLSDSERAHCINLFKIASIIQYTLPGFPSVYYGDEIGMEGCKDPFNRCGYPWGSDEINTELLHFFIELGKLRTGRPLLKDAPFVPISGAQGCVAYARENENGSLIVIANRADADIDYYLPEKYANAKLIFGDAEKRLGEKLVKVSEESFAILEL